MHSYKTIFIFIIFITLRNYAQFNQPSDSLNISITKFRISNDTGHLSSFHLNESYMFDSSLSQKLLFINPGFNLTNNYLLNHDSQLKLFLDIPQNNFNQSFELKQFKESLNKVLAFKYKDLMKYDLRTIGRYLYISKKVLAIILAILSL